MSSVLLLEKGGRWRAVTAFLVFLLAASPLISLAGAAMDFRSGQLGDAFWQSFSTTIGIAFSGSFVGLALGLPLGVGMAVADFPGKRAILVVMGFPLVVPSFLWAIGWSTLTSRFAPIRALGDGFSGCVLVAATTTAVLVLFAGYAGALGLSRSQHEAALLAGGERALLRRASRHAAVPAALAAAFGAVLTLADSGPGQILGVHTVSAEILATFAAQYDLTRAASQCVVLTLVVFTLSFPLAWLAGPRLAEGLLARQLGEPRPRRSTPLGATVGVGAVVVLLLMILPPVLGLLLPILSRDPSALRTNNHLQLVLLGALPTVTRTAVNSLLYAAGAGMCAALFGAVTAVAAGRSRRLRIATLSASVVLFSWPSIASALAVAQLGASAPRGLDVVLRSRLSVCFVLALHFAPIATVLLLRAMGTVSPSWTQAAAIHGVALRHYFGRVLWPALRPSAVVSFLLVALLASADAGSVLLLHPPGEPSFALAIVTTMANAPEAFVSGLCLAYLVSSAAVLAATLLLVRRWGAT